MESQTSKLARKIQRGVIFSAFEDEMLCKAWLTTERDPVVSSTRFNKAYWDRILFTFDQLMGGVTRRSIISLMSRWKTIHQSLSKFRELLTQITTDQNGLTESDRVSEAKRVYHDVHGQPFKLENCWNVLKGTTKWEEPFLAKTNTKLEKPTLGNDVSASGLGISLIPTTPSSTPSTPSTVPSDSDVDPISLEDPCKERSVRRKMEKEGSKACSHLTKVDEANMILNTFLSDFKERLQKSEEIALRELHLKEKKMLERKTEKEQKIMDMDLNGMLPMRREYYLARQREILADWTASGQTGGLNDGRGGLQSEGNSGGQNGQGTL